MQTCSKPRGARGIDPKTFRRRGQLLSCPPTTGPGFVLCATWYVRRAMCYVVCATWYVLRGMCYVLCGMCYVLRCMFSVLRGVFPMLFKVVVVQALLWPVRDDGSLLSATQRKQQRPGIAKKTNTNGTN